MKTTRSKLPDAAAERARRLEKRKHVMEAASLSPPTSPITNNKRRKTLDAAPTPAPDPVPAPAPATAPPKQYKPRIKPAGKMVLEVEFSPEAAAARTSELNEDLRPDSEKSQQWYASLERLRAYKEQYGHCNVPYRWKEDTALGNWVRNQRVRYGSQKMPDYRRLALEALGFEWRLQATHQSQVINLGSPEAAKNPVGRPKKVQPGSQVVNPGPPVAKNPVGRPKKVQPVSAVAVEPIHTWTRTPQTNTTAASEVAATTQTQFETEPQSTPRARGRPRASMASRAPRPPSAVAEAKWNAQFEQLKAFKEEHGHTDVPITYPEDQTFSNWVRMQRDKHNYPHRGVLSEDRIAKLEEIDFDWKEPKTSAPPKPFEEMIVDLQRYREDNGNVDVPKRLALGAWLYRQKEKYHEQSLDFDRIQQLEALGVEWTVEPSSKPKKTFSEYLTELQAYKAQKGDILVPKSRNLGQWLARQKELYHERRLEQDQIAQLEELEIDWTLPPRKKTWEEQLAVLVAYHMTHGTSNVPSTYQDEAGLRNWVKTQREWYHQQKLSQDQIMQLQALEFDFSLPPKRKSWDDMLKDLKAFKEETGNFHVPDDYEEEPALSKWVQRQRALYAKQKLSTNQIEKLQAIGFDWSIASKPNMWEDKLDQLRRYKETHGDVNRVSSTYKVAPGLCHWVARQRDLRHREKLSEEQIEKLDALGLNWDGPRRYKYTSEEVWQAHFEKLKEFQLQHGHCGIPSNFPDDLSLLEWIHGQHVAYLKRRMPQDRIDKLESIGFAWRHDIEITDDDEESNEDDRKMPASINPINSVPKSVRGPRISWQKHYEMLKTHLLEQGDFDVSVEYDAKLADWVRQQRRYYNRGKGLTEKKKELLDLIEFNWDGPDTQLNITGATTTTTSTSTSPTAPLAATTTTTAANLPTVSAGSTPKATAAAARLPTTGAAGRMLPRTNSDSTTTTGGPPPPPPPPPPTGGPPRMAHPNFGTSPVAIAQAAAAAATASARAQQAEDRQIRQQMQADMNHLRMALANLQTANQQLAKQLQDSETARKDDIVILRNSLRRHDDQLAAQLQTIQNQTTQIATLTQTVDTLRQAHQFQLQQQQEREREQRQQQQQQHQPQYNFPYRL